MARVRVGGGVDASAFTQDVPALLVSLRGGDAGPWLRAARAQPAAVVNEPDETGATALHWFALRGEEAHMLTALQLGAKIDVATKNGQTPLMYAVHSGNLRAVDVAIQHGAPLDTRDSTGATALTLAVQHGWVLISLSLLDRGASISQVDATGCNLVHWAANKNHVPILRVLRNRLPQAAFLAEDAEGYTPLLRAATGAAPDACVYLMEEVGAEPRLPRFAARDGLTLGALKDSQRVPRTGGAREDSDEEGTTGDAVDERTSLTERMATGASTPSMAAGKRRQARALGSMEAGMPENAPSTGSLAAPTASNTRDTKPASLLAEEALRTLIARAREDDGIGEGRNAAAYKQAILRQREAVVVLKAAEERLVWRDASFLGCAVFWARYVFGTPSIRARCVTPSLYLGLTLFTILTWTLRALPYASTGWAFFVALAFTGTQVAYYLLYTSDPGALDPYGVLGRDKWSSTGPLSMFRNPFMRTPAPRTPALADQLGSGAIPSSSAFTKAASAVGSKPLTASGEIDYAALVELELGGSDSDPVQPATSAASPTSAMPSTPTQQFIHDFRTALADVRSAWGVYGKVDLSGMLEASTVAGADMARFMESRMCSSCELVRPVRGKHDAKTGRCYDRYDHFCYWVGIPITAGNHARFLIFLLLQFIVAIVYCADVWSWTGAPLLNAPASAQHPGRWTMFATSNTNIAFALVSLLGALFTGGMLVQQLSQIASNLTTNEAINAYQMPQFQSVMADRYGTLHARLVNPYTLSRRRDNLAEFVGWRVTRRQPTATSVVAHLAKDMDNVCVEVQQRLQSALVKAHEQVARLESSLSRAQEEEEEEGGGGALPRMRVSGVPEGQATMSPMLAMSTLIVAMAQGGPSDADSMRELQTVLSVLPNPIPLEMVRVRVLVQRAQLIADNAWEALNPRARGGHGHSHAGGGHGHGGHGNGGGHGHGGGGGGGGGSHGHSHGGRECDGKH